MGVNMPIKLSYVIHFVADMEYSIGYYRDTLGFNLKFQSPDWSEFITGETTLALYKASSQNPAGKMQLGFRVKDISAFYREMIDKGFSFTQAPTLEEGSMLARFLDKDDLEYSVSGE
jgi:catechol 2,3-dioxygenase-like lactoylglutathione lyase family enzyme